MEYIHKLQEAIINLEKCERVIKYNTKEENQASTLAHALIDIEESIDVIKNKIPQIYSNDLTKEEVDDLVLDIGEELRHVLYHIKDTKVYDYLNQ
ncbi:MAG: hypothetical protein H7282_14280 [Cytophagaceae bacterium]|nr:hypothetical protein [Cytophagaceae bacterium]